jgi:hypothetical protein
MKEQSRWDWGSCTEASALIARASAPTLSCPFPVQRAMSSKQPRPVEHAVSLLCLAMGSAEVRLFAASQAEWFLSQGPGVLVCPVVSQTPRRRACP